MRRDSGFTLFEVLAVITIIAIVVALAIPNYIAWIPKYKTRQATMDLVANMNLAKLKAVKSNEEWALVFDQAQNRYLLCSYPGGDGNWTNTGDNTIEKTVDLAGYNAGVQFASLSSSSVTFTSRGAATYVQVGLTNKSSSASYRVQTSIAGGIISDRL